MKIKAFKGFNPDMTCKKFKFVPGVEYSMDEDKINLCTRGFHSCIIPLQCFSYYKPLAGVFHEVEIDGAMEIAKANSKIVSSKITVEEHELDSKEIVNETYDCIEMLTGDTDYHDTILEDLSEKLKNSKIKGSINVSNAYRSIAASNIDDDLGNGSVINTGGKSIAASVGNDKCVATSDTNSIAASVGKTNNVISAGSKSIAASVGDYNLVTAGNQGVIAVSIGEQCKVIAEKAGSMAIITTDSIGKGALNSYLVFVNTVKNADDTTIDKVITIFIDGSKYRPNTWYKLDNGVVKEA